MPRQSVNFIAECEVGFCKEDAIGMVIGIVCALDLGAKALTYAHSHDIIELLHDSDIYVYKGMVSVNPEKCWRAKVRSRMEPEKGDSRIWLLGDAIHPMLPNR